MWSITIIIISRCISISIKHPSILPYSSNNLCTWRESLEAHSDAKGGVFSFESMVMIYSFTTLRLFPGVYVLNVT